MRKFIIFLFLILLWASSGWSQTTFHVTSDAELDSALASDANGDTIIIESSFTSAGGVYSIDKIITMYGSPSSSTITLGTDDNYLFTLAAGSGGSTIRDFVINCDKASRTTGTAILVSSAGAGNTISGMTINNCFNYGILVGANGRANISGNTINTPGGVGISKSTSGNCVRVNTNSNTISQNVCNGDSSGSDGIFINGVDLNVVTGNEINTPGKDGIRVYNGSDSNTVSLNTITNVGQGENSDHIYVGGLANIISQNTLTQSSDTGYNVWAFEVAGGADAADGTEISKNTVTGAYMDRGLGGGGSQITISQNYFEVIDYGIYYQNTDGTVAQNNFFKVTGGTAGIMWDSFSAGTRSAHTYNNTIYDGGGTGTGIRYEEGTGTFVSSIVKNNYVIGFDKGLVIEDKDNDGIGITHQNNGYYDNTANIQKDVGGSFSAISLDTGEITSDPLLIDPDNGDFSIPIISPAVNAGTNPYSDGDGDIYSYNDILIFSDDVDKVVAPGGKIDIGAFEYPEPVTIQGNGIGGIGLN